jgi:hypothetical protein
MSRVVDSALVAIGPLDANGAPAGQIAVDAGMPYIGALPTAEFREAFALTALPLWKLRRIALRRQSIHGLI